MPLYEYQCQKCGHRFERIQKFSDQPIKKCPQCGGAVEKLLSAPAVQFKGSGWYVTDYAKKGGSGGDAHGSEGKDKKPDTAKKDAGATDSKSEAKPKISSEKK